MTDVPFLKIAGDDQRRPCEAAEDLAASSRRRHVALASFFVSAAALTVLVVRSPSHSLFGPSELVGKDTYGTIFDSRKVGASWLGHGVCVKDTGGSCKIFGCGSFRGPTDCIKGKCVCKEGSCVAGNGICAPPDTCLPDTGFHCNFLKCREYLGPTDCNGFINHKCECKPGWCAVRGSCVENVTTMTAKVVKLNARERKFPGPHGRVRTAVTCAGGGTRACAVCMGLLRAFEFHGLMQYVDALGAASGGAWAAAPYMFSDRSLIKLLGPVTTPELLSMDVLRRPPGEVGRIASTNIVRAISSQSTDQFVGPHQAWYTAIARNFLGPFGLADKYAHMAASKEDVHRIKAMNPQLKHASFLVPAADRPKVFIITGTIIRPREDMTNEDGVVGLQVSPDFTGSPFRVDRKEVEYTEADNATEEWLVVGGALVETFAFGGPPPQSQSKEGYVQMPAPGRPFSLALAVAVSSNFYAGNFGGFESIQRTYWGEGHQHERAIVWQMGDGGLLDNSIMHPMLQRGATRFVWFIPTQLKFHTKPDYCGGEAALGTSFNNSWVSDDIADKFGYGECSGGFFRCHNKVFAKEDYLPLLCEMKKVYADKGPLVVRRRLRLVTNTYWQIKGGRTIEVLIVYNTLAQPFVDALPQDTREEISKGSDGMFANFPAFDIFAQNGMLSGGALHNAQINLLAAHTEYMVASRLPLFQNFLFAT